MMGQSAKTEPMFYYVVRDTGGLVRRRWFLGLVVAFASNWVHNGENRQ
jgi:hypothetical protein